MAHLFIYYHSIYPAFSIPMLSLYSLGVMPTMLWKARVKVELLLYPTITAMSMTV